MGTSAGGARPKAVVCFNPDTGQIRSGQMAAPEGYEYWLLKLDGIDEDRFGPARGYGRVEYAYSLMAGAAGVVMEPCRLLIENDRAHFMTRRFDRRPDDSKIHAQTLCALDHLDFNQADTNSYAQYLDVIDRLGLGADAREQAFRRVVLNVAGSNRDDHTKNLSFCCDDGGRWSLAPAYDVNYAHNPQGKWTQRHQMSVNGKFEGITQADLLELADRFVVPSPRPSSPTSSPPWTGGPGSPSRPGCRPTMRSASPRRWPTSGPGRPRRRPDARLVGWSVGRREMGTTPGIALVETRVAELPFVPTLDERPTMHSPSTLRRLAAIATSAAAMGALGTVSAGSLAPAGAATHKAESCNSYKPGNKGVIGTFCKGSVVVKLKIGTTTSTIKGGKCSVGGGYFTVNAGVVIDSTFKGAKPNYFGLDAPPKATTFTNATLTYTVNGVGGAVTQNSGTIAANHKSGTFTGTELTGSAVSGSFTC